MKKNSGGRGGRGCHSCSCFSQRILLPGLARLMLAVACKKKTLFFSTHPSSFLSCLVALDAGAGMGADNFVCVESAKVEGGNLAAGKTWTGKMKLLPA